MKRRLSILLLLVLSVGLLIPCAGAEEPGGAELMGVGTIPAYVTVSDNEAEQGGEVSVAVSLTRVTFSNLALQIGFDTDALELKAVKMETLKCPLREKSPDGTAMLWSSAGNVTWSGGTIATLTFSVRADARPGEHAITVGHYLGRSDLAKPYEPGIDCNYMLNGLDNRVALKLFFQSGTLTVAEPPCALAAADKGGGTFQVSMTGPSPLDGKLVAAWYAGSGQMKQVRLLEPKGAQDVSFPQAVSGDRVKFMWVTDQYVPRCEAVEKTVT